MTMMPRRSPPPLSRVGVESLASSSVRAAGVAGAGVAAAGREVVPRDAGAVKVRRVNAGEHGHGIGRGKRAWSCPRGRGTAAADHQKGAEQSIAHSAPRGGGPSGPRAGRSAFLQGYILTGATPDGV